MARAAGLCLLVVAVSIIAKPAAAQESTGSAGRGEANAVRGKTPLATRQEMIRERFKRFEDRMFRLREKLKINEPESAARLARALERAGELGLRDQLNAMIEALNDPSKLQAAIEDQADWLLKVDAVLGILLERESGNEDREKRMEQLEQYRHKLRDILKQQRSLRDASARAAAAQQLGEQLEQAQGMAEDLLERQQDLKQETQEAREPEDGGAQKLQSDEAERIKGEQERLSRQANELAETLEEIGRSEPDQSADSQALQDARAQANEAAKALRQAAESMAEASQSAGRQQAKETEQRQQRAEEQTRRARDRLQEARKELHKEKTGDTEAGEQRDTADQTQQLGDQMQQDAESEESPSWPGQQGQSAPGQQNLQQAEKNMRRAAEELDKDQPDDAKEQQDKALESLERAQKQLEDELNQLRKEDRQETLRDLESRFRNMLDKQRRINEQTFELDKFGKKNFGRAEQLQLADLSAKEAQLSEKSRSALHILEEEGTTIVFPRIVEQMAEDMSTVAKRLEDRKVSTLTQHIEQQILDTLEQLIEAVQRMQQENEQQDNQNQQQGGEQNSPLLPASAELKLLRASQMRVNTRTKVIEEARQAGAESDASLRDSLKAAAERQRECADIAREMRDRPQQ